MKNDIFDKMTKAEVVSWINSKYFTKPKMSEVLFIRWQIEDKRVLDEDRALCEEFEAIRADPTRKNEYADHFKRCEKNRKAFDRCYKLYARIGVVRKNEIGGANK